MGLLYHICQTLNEYEVVYSQRVVRSQGLPGLVVAEGGIFVGEQGNGYVVTPEDQATVFRSLLNGASDKTDTFVSFGWNSGESANAVDGRPAEDEVKRFFGTGSPSGPTDFAPRVIGGDMHLGVASFSKGSQGLNYWGTNYGLDIGDVSGPDDVKDVSLRSYGSSAEKSSEGQVFDRKSVSFTIANGDPVKSSLVSVFKADLSDHHGNERSEGLFGDLLPKEVPVIGGQDSDSLRMSRHGSFLVTLPRREGTYEIRPKRLTARVLERDTNKEVWSYEGSPDNLRISFSQGDGFDRLQPGVNYKINIRADGETEDGPHVVRDAEGREVKLNVEARETYRNLQFTS